MLHHELSILLVVKFTRLYRFGKARFREVRLSLPILPQQPGKAVLRRGRLSSYRLAGVCIDHLSNLWHNKNQKGDDGNE